MTHTHKKAVLAFWESLPQVQSDLERVAGVLQTVADRVPQYLRPQIRESLNQLLRRPGKGLRPALLLQAARLGTLEDRHYDLAAGVELLHLATLVHDDIVDGSPLRRGQPSFHAQKGLAQGVLYGDLLFSLCFELVSQSCSPENARILARVVTFMAGSEIIQDLDRYTLPTSQRRILKRMTGKTASLFSLSLAVGASEAGLGISQVDRLRRLGYRLGLTFQLQDDLLDFSSHPTVGKQTQADLPQGHFTLPVYFALKKNPHLGPELLNLKNNPGNASRVYNEITQGGGVASAQNLLERWTDSLEKSLDQWGFQTLAPLFHRILGREL